MNQSTILIQRIRALKSFAAITTSAIAQLDRDFPERILETLEQSFSQVVLGSGLSEHLTQALLADVKEIIGRARIDLHKKAKDRSINVQFTTSDNLINVDFSNRK